MEASVVKSGCRPAPGLRLTAYDLRLTTYHLRLTTYDLHTYD
ncbi:MAG TPA: hypothetical protein PKE06_14925 [Flavilitoribacter sp.]|nr:hypothetical protein [Flavilitoribacter sp.]